MASGTAGKGGPEFSISLETNDPELNKNELSVVVTVLQKKLVPDPPQSVLILLNGIEIARKETDQDGHVVTEATLPGPGSYRLIAQLEATPSIRVSRLIIVKEPVKKSAKAIKTSVQVIGKCGEQKLFICAVAEDGSLVAGAKGVLIDGEIVKPFTTDETGTYVYPTNLTEERAFYVCIGEDDQNNKQRAWRGVLLGK